MDFFLLTSLLVSSHYIFGWSFKIMEKLSPLIFLLFLMLRDPNNYHSTLILSVSVFYVALVLLLVVLALYLVNKIKNMDVTENLYLVHGSDLIVIKGEKWRFYFQVFIPRSNVYTYTSNMIVDFFLKNPICPCFVSML